MLGRYIFAVGNDPAAAELIGLPKRRVSLLVYGFSGFCCALTALYLVGRFGAGQPYTGVNYTLASITPVIVGGTLLDRRARRRLRHAARRIPDRASEQPSEFHGCLEALPTGRAGPGDHSGSVGLRREAKGHMSEASLRRAAPDNAARPGSRLPRLLQAYGIYAARLRVRGHRRRGLAGLHQRQ